MATLQDARKMLPDLSNDDKRQLLRLVVRELGGGYPGIETSPDVLGGDPRPVRTRIPVWLLEQARRQGTSDAELLEAYPSLRAEDLVNAWNYVEANAAEIDQQIGTHEAA